MKLPILQFAHEVDRVESDHEPVTIDHDAVIVPESDGPEFRLFQDNLRDVWRDWALLQD